MKSRKTLLWLLAVLFTASGTLTAFSLRNNDEKLPGEFTPVTAEKLRSELTGQVESMLALYNSRGERALRRRFPSGSIPDKTWEKLGTENPVAKSLSVLSDCGRKLKLENPECFSRGEDSAVFLVTGTVSAERRLSFTLVRNNGNYYLNVIAPAE